MNRIGTVGTQVQQNAQAQPSPRLVRAAHEFEGQMMKELLKPLNSGNGLDGDDDGDTGSTGALSDFASEALGQALSQSGGFGIADSIVRRLSHSGTASTGTLVTGKGHFDTRMRPLR